MEENNVLKIAIAETSVIIRNGLALVLKRIQGMKILPIEVVSLESLSDCMRLQKPDVLIINSAFPGFFDVRKFKEELVGTNVKCIALISSVVDNSLLKHYDETFSLYDDPEILKEKLNKLLHVEEIIEPEVGQDVLSSREKEIIICVVKGMTNKEIADFLFLSTHTVITHRRNIARKLQIHSPSGLTIYAIVNKLVELQDIKDYL